MRLREIFAINKPFGGVSVIVVGDLNQLQPVLDDWIFKPNKNNLADLLGYNIWEIFKCVELKEIMRQKDKFFSEALTNLANGEMSLDEINLFKARQLNNISYNVPPDAVRLFYDKISVKTYNTYKLKSLKTESHLCLAIDVIRGHGSKAQKKFLLDKAASEEEDVTNQIAYEIELKIEAKYMLLVNLNVSDGLTNDSTGI